MPDNAEEKVSKFYNTVGWETKSGITEDAKRFGCVSFELKSGQTAKGSPA